jgi:hypothetical protein
MRHINCKMEIVSVKERDCVIRTKRTLGMDRDVRVGDILSTYRTRVTFPKDP